MSDKPNPPMEAISELVSPRESEKPSSKEIYSKESYEALLKEREFFTRETWASLNSEQRLEHIEKLLKFDGLLGILGDERTLRQGDTVYNKYFATTDDSADVLYFGSTTCGNFSARNRRLLGEEVGDLQAAFKELTGNEYESADIKYARFMRHIKDKYKQTAQELVLAFPFEHPEKIGVVFCPTGTESEMIFIMAAKGLTATGEIYSIIYPHAGSATAAAARGEYGNLQNWAGERALPNTKIPGLEVAATMEFGTDADLRRKATTNQVAEAFDTMGTLSPLPVVVQHHLTANKLGRSIGDLAYDAFLRKKSALQMVLAFDGAQGRDSPENVAQIMENGYQPDDLNRYLSYEWRGHANGRLAIDTKAIAADYQANLQRIPKLFAISTSKKWGSVAFGDFIFLDQQAQTSVGEFLGKQGGLNKDQEFYLNSHMFPGMDKAVPKDPIEAANEVPNIPLLLRLRSGLRNITEYQDIPMEHMQNISRSLEFAASDRLSRVPGAKLYDSAPANITFSNDRGLDSNIVFALRDGDRFLTKAELDSIHKKLATGGNAEKAQRVVLGPPVLTADNKAYLRLAFSATDVIEVYDEALEYMSTGENMDIHQALSRAITDKIVTVAKAINIVQQTLKEHLAELHPAAVQEKEVATENIATS